MDKKQTDSTSMSRNKTAKTASQARLSSMIRTRETEQKNNTVRNRETAVSGIRAIEGQGNERKFVLSFSSEEPYQRFWGTEILDHSDGAADLTRLNSIGCLLYNHNRDAVIGRVIRAWTENNRGCAEVEFDTDAESEKIYQKVKSGSLKGVSVGYIISNTEQVKSGQASSDGRFMGPCEVARRWCPLEVSIVSVPADGTVGVGRSMEDSIAPLDIFERQLQINKNKIGR